MLTSQSRLKIQPQNRSQRDTHRTRDRWTENTFATYKNSLPR